MEWSDDYQLKIANIYTSADDYIVIKRVQNQRGPYDPEELFLENSSNIYINHPSTRMIIPRTIGNVSPSKMIIFNNIIKNQLSDKYQQALKFVIKEAFDDDGFYIGK